MLKSHIKYYFKQVYLDTNYFSFLYASHTLASELRVHSK